MLTYNAILEVNLSEKIEKIVVTGEAKKGTAMPSHATVQQLNIKEGYAMPAKTPGTSNLVSATPGSAVPPKPSKD